VHDYGRLDFFTGAHGTLHPLRVSSLLDFRIFLSCAIEREREAAVKARYCIETIA
jgi:hypothetical protein